MLAAPAPRLASPRQAAVADIDFYMSVGVPCRGVVSAAAAVAAERRVWLAPRSAVLASNVCGPLRAAQRLCHTGLMCVYAESRCFVSCRVVFY